MVSGRVVWVLLPFETPADAVNAMRIIGVTQGLRGAVVEPTGELAAALARLFEERLDAEPPA